MKKLIFFSFIIIALWNEISYATNPADSNWRDYFKSYINSTVNNIVASERGVFITGYFSQDEFYGPVYSIAKWDSTHWAPLDTVNFKGLNGIGCSLLLSDSILYFGGSFDSAFSKPFKNIAKFDLVNNTFDSLEAGVNKTVLALAKLNDKIIVGGEFDTPGNTRVNHIAIWNDTTWENLNSGINGDVYCIAVKDSLIYVGGKFDSVGNIKALNVACWNTSSNTWTSLSGGIIGDAVFSLLIDETNNVYAGGFFDKAINNSDTINTYGIAKWNGQGWDSLCNNNILQVMALQFDSNNNIIIAGSFSEVCNDSANNIAKWDGSNIYSFGSGVKGFISSTCIWDNKIFVAGDFYQTGETSSQFVGVWSENPNIFSIFNDDYKNEFYKNTMYIFSIYDDIKIENYPNPTFDNVNVKIYNKSSGNFSFYISDYLGRDIIKYKEKFLMPEDSYSFKIDLSELNSGLYYLKVIKDEKILYKPIILIR